MRDLRQRLGPWTGVALALCAVSAQASLVPLGPEDFQGTGLGAVNTILTITSPANSTFESGSVAFGNVTSGDVLTGTSQTQTRTLSELGVSSAGDLRVVFNALEPGNVAENGITLDNLVLTIYSSTGTVLFTSGAFTSVSLADTETGAGNSGFVFGLDATQQAAAAGAFADQSNVVALSATAGCNAESPPGCLDATGGFETFFVASAPPVSVIPEPGTVALMLAGLGVIGFMAKRRAQH